MSDAPYNPLSFSTTGGYDNSQIGAPLKAAQNAAVALAGSTYDPTNFSNTGGWYNVMQDAINSVTVPLSTVPIVNTILKDDNKKDSGDGRNSGSGPDSPVKVATPDLINVFSLQKYNDVPIDSMADIIFEDLGGQELINVSRTDLINGQNIDYQPISNLGQILIENSPSNIIKLQSTSKAYFDSLPIVLEDFIPTVGLGPSGEVIYMDTSSGENIWISVVNMTSDKLVQVEFITYGSMINDIIYP